MISFLTRRSKHRFLDKCATLSTGALSLTTPDGDAHEFGTGVPQAEMHVYDWAALTKAPLGQTYAAGLWDTSSLRDLCILMQSNPMIFTQHAPKWPTRNPRGREIGNEFYQLWLDQGMSFTSALYDSTDCDLEQAQTRKYDRVLERIATGHKVLDVGCGWGSFAERAADRGQDVTGLTLSASQKGYADARLDGRADIRRQDLRAEDQIYDNIVSLETLNTMSVRHYPTYLKRLRDRLAENGRIVLQAITAPKVQPHGPGQAPSVATLRHLAEQAGLRLVESFAFGDSYARTFAHWQDRLDHQTTRLAHLGFDTPFQREWRYALATSSARFQTGRADVMQFELAHRRAKNS